MANVSPILTIGFDAKRAMSNFTGLGNYSRYTIEALSLHYPDNKYYLYAPKAPTNDRAKGILGLPGVSLHTPQGAVMSKLSALWRSLDVTQTLINDDISLYHGLSNELPLNIGASGLPSVVTIHDVIWRRYPADYTWIDRRLYDFKYGKSMRSATRIIAISERTKADIIADFDINPDKIDVIYQGIHPVFHAEIDFATKEAVRERYNLPDTYIVMVGTVQGRKNQLLAVKALRALPPDIKLMIVGRCSGSYARQVQEYISSHGLQSRVIWLENVPLEDLPALYAKARCAAYPSRYEGFGLPVVEALACGVPVIAATGSCLEEAGGGGAVYVNPDDDEEFAHQAMSIISDTYRHDKMLEIGRRHIKKFNTGEFARLTIAAYKKAIVEKVLG